MVKENKTTYTLIVGLILALFLLVGQSYMLTSQNAEREVISVSGKSEMSVQPDEAEIYLTITTENNDAQKAQEENKVLSAKVIESLKAQGIDEKNIETQNFRLNENYDYDYYPYVKTLEVEEKVVPQYEAVHTLKVKTSELNSIGTLIDVSIKAGANGVNNIQYTLSDELESQVRAQSLDKAILAGKDKAEAMTNTLQVSLGKVTNIQENNYYYSPYSFAANVKADSFDGAEAASLNYLSPQSVEVRSTVQLEFELEN